MPITVQSRSFERLLLLPKNLCIHLHVENGMKTGENYKAEAFFKVEGHPSVMKMRAEMVLNGILDGDKEYARQVIEMYELAFPAQGKKT